MSPSRAAAAATAALVWAGTLALPAAADAWSPHRATVYSPSDSIGGWGRGFGYGLVFSLDQARDDLLAPLLWSGLGIGLKSSWTWGGGDTRQVLSVTIPLSVLSNRFGHAGYALAPTVAYGYLAPVARRASGSRVWMGGRLRLDMFNGYYESWDDEHLYWLTAYSVGPTVAWRGRAGGQTAWLDLDAPLVAAVSRPRADRLNQIDRLTKLSGHFVDTQRDLRFATLPDYAALHATAGIIVRVAGRSLSLSYDLDWSTYASPSRVTVLAHRLTVGHRASH